MRSLPFQLTRSTQLLLRHLGKLIVLGKKTESAEEATKELSTFKTKAFLVLDLDLDLDDGVHRLPNEARSGEVEAGCREGDIYLFFLIL